MCEASNCEERDEHRPSTDIEHPVITNLQQKNSVVTFGFVQVADSPVSVEEEHLPSRGAHLCYSQHDTPHNEHNMEFMDLQLGRTLPKINLKRRTDTLTRVRSLKNRYNVPVPGYLLPYLCQYLCNKNFILNNPILYVFLCVK